MTCSVALLQLIVCPSCRNVLVVLGTLYEGLGLMAGSSYMEVVQILAKVAKQPEVCVCYSTS